MILQKALERLQAPAHERQKQQVLTAVKKLNLTVTPDEVAAEAGLPLLKTNQLLNTIAYETGAHLSVDTAGSIAYKFSPNFESHYLIDSSRNMLGWLSRLFWNALKLALKLVVLGTFFLIRASIGLALIASVVIVVALIVAAIVAAIANMFAGSEEGGDALGTDGAGSGGGFWPNFDWVGSMRYWCFDWCWDWWHWHYYFDDDQWQSGYACTHTGSATGHGLTTSSQELSPSNPSSQTHDNPLTKKTSFIDNCFALLFGVGDPNTNWDLERWRVVADAIKAKSGVVLAEDLAPYLEQTGRDEDWMLPVLVRFNGYPEVSQSGKLIYVFPSLVPVSAPAVETNQTSELSNLYANFISRQKATKVARMHSTSLPMFVQKRLIPVCGLDGNALASVWFAASIALGGALWLVCAGGSHVPYIDMLRPGLIGIAVYGGLFFLLPAFRLPFVIHQNSKISDENEARAAAAQKLRNPDQDLRRWQAEAELIRADSISGNVRTQAYTTETDSLEQQLSEEQLTTR